MSSGAPSSDLLERLVADLMTGSRRTLSRTAVERVLLESLRDLSGSVSRESLPEMATRLAGARMGVRPGVPDEADGRSARTAVEGPRSRPLVTADSPAG